MSEPLNEMKKKTSFLNVFFFIQPSTIKSAELMNLERKATVRDFCKRTNRLNESVNTPGLNNILANEKFKILFCYIPKVACTQWKTVMMQLNQSEPKYLIHDKRNFNFLSHYPREKAEEMLKTFFKFVFVREPFERLLSAYIDKFYNNDPGFYSLWGPHIVSRYKKGMTPEETKITFDEFVSFVVRLNDRGMHCNEHWQTYDKLCKPCGINYDFIGQFENLEREARHVLEFSGLNKSVLFPEIKPSITWAKIPSFYSQLSKETLNIIVRIFRGDSEMFGYDLPKSFV